MKKVFITRKPGVVSHFAYEPPTNFGIHNDQTVDPTPSKPQSYGEPFARRRERKKWGIKRVLPFVKRFQTLNNAVKAAEEALNKWKVDLSLSQNKPTDEAYTEEAKAETIRLIKDRLTENTQQLESRIQALNEFFQKLPFPRYKLGV